jgi:DNA primase large subunit
VTIEEFEECAIDRLRILAEIESSYARNRSWEDLKTVITKQCDLHLPLDANTARTLDLQAQRRKDHIGHFVLRLAFCRSWVELDTIVLDQMASLHSYSIRDELRRRFIKTESTLFRIRYDTDSPQDRAYFIGSRNFNWTPVSLQFGFRGHLSHSH